MCNTAHVQYGLRVRATAVSLTVQQLIPEDRVCETMAGTEIFATMRSVISTTRKHGINILRALTMPTGNLVDLLSA